MFSNQNAIVLCMCVHVCVCVCVCVCECVCVHLSHVSNVGFCQPGKEDPVESQKMNAFPSLTKSGLTEKTDHA
jgi:hypothetical protein